MCPGVPISLLLALKILHLSCRATLFYVSGGFLTLVCTRLLPNAKQLKQKILVLCHLVVHHNLLGARGRFLRRLHSHFSVFVILCQGEISRFVQWLSIFDTVTRISLKLIDLIVISMAEQVATFDIQHVASYLTYLKFQRGSQDQISV